MEYTIQKLAELAGVTTRTLRWYHRIGLLTPSRIGENGYRYYGGAEGERLPPAPVYRGLRGGAGRVGGILCESSLYPAGGRRGPAAALVQGGGGAPGMG